MQQQQLENIQGLAKVASWKKFSELFQVRAAMNEYINCLRSTSVLLGGRGKCVEDQDYPIEVFSFQPVTDLNPPIILIGGMGPLAGAEIGRAHV